MIRMVFQRFLSGRMLQVPVNGLHAGALSVAPLGFPPFYSKSVLTESGESRTIDRMTSAQQWREALRAFRDGKLSEDEIVSGLLRRPVEELGFATVDTHRAARQGVGEVIFGQGKTPEQLAAIAEALVSAHGRVLATRVDESQAVALEQVGSDGVYDPMARIWYLSREEPRALPGYAAVVTAGTSDRPVAEEAAQTAEFLGLEARRVIDVGVAGLHRVLGKVDVLRDATVVIVVAGMEGALPSVVAGLVDRPVIASPTSVGYGASFGGIAALLGMLNSCGSGVMVTNIDNGFGAGFAAVQIARAVERGCS